ncbi:plasmid pRiA4b ORF-3 family protein [Algiphilus sp. W345]|uniref:Plasmid pRiA4b ORF-3 family protein n=1 Tax=Banduia mediterranea TaxID=3075609 RepID=A0ABU2WFQ4_9GAMM|nr:plasmid pRiA4b ORF-3 family protein [Algiphilus sp. W345]MDT0496676.1 plasmid pRiA4b ORF-3 family protein [Algiphilus sp. W345]
MSTVHRLKIVLRNTRPTVSREVLVSSDLRLDRLHEIIQVVMGWEDAHMHEFSNGVRGPDGLRFGLPQQEFFDDPLLRDERKGTLAQLAPDKGSKFVYWYDFGDDWFHDISVKAVNESKSGIQVPVCLKAAGACPPEYYDIEGVNQMLAAMAARWQRKRRQSRPG